ncbi:FtsK/SpoIIIE domain-containing protein, partial [Bifidobacterium catenulatum]
MKGKNKRKHTNGFNEDRLMLISWAAPVLAQLVMLVVMIAQRQWLYVAMLAPGLIGSAMSLVSMALRSRQKQQYDEPADATPSKVAETLERTIDRPSFAAMPRVCFEHLYGLNDDMLPWRTIARTWLSPTSSCLLGITQHGLFRTDLQRSGPHAIVAGTTGSGKSELLISWCLSLAMQYSP